MSENFYADGRPVLVRLRDVTREYHISARINAAALRGVSLDIFVGEFISITGASGSGKTTLLNLIGLLDNSDGGEIWINGHEASTFTEEEKVNFRLKFIGIVFQFFNLIETYSALGNITFQLRLQGYVPRVAKEKAEHILEFVGLKERANYFPKELSGGEQQRVAIGRALAKDSLLIIADEPTAHLDTQNAQRVMDLLRDINKHFGKTVVLVTHERGYAEQADRVVVLQDGKVLDLVKSVQNSATFPAKL
ncbi:MAG: ABC transporter ATP-binding protein [bacterium]|nr:ABC transporter ATP-binding protein [bacterium]